MSNAEIVKRLEAIESEIAALKASVGLPPHRHPIEVINQIHGTFADDKAFNEAMRLGREWRKRDRPRSRKSRASRK
jgi:hypothetical protein